MTWTSSAGALKLRSARWWIVAALLLLVGTGCLVVGLPGHQHPLAGPTQPASPSSQRQTAPTRPAIVAPVVARSEPVVLRIPAIGLSVPLSTLGLNYEGAGQRPTAHHQAGLCRVG